MSSSAATTRRTTRSSVMAGRTAKDTSPLSENVDGDIKNSPPSLASRGKAAHDAGYSLKRKRGLQASRQVSTPVKAKIDSLKKSKKASSRTTAGPAAIKSNQDPATTLLTEDVSDPPKKGKQVQSRAKNKDQDQEKRLRVFRQKAPLSYLEKLARATSQRYSIHHPSLQCTPKLLQNVRYRQNAQRHE